MPSTDPRKRKLARDKYERAHPEAAARWRAIGRRTQNRKRRTAVLSAYGGKCACCGEAQRDFLCIDHIWGGGSKHIQSLKAPLYHWLRREGYPPGFQVLCFNCNASKGSRGWCVHEKAKHELPLAVCMDG